MADIHTINPVQVQKFLKDIDYPCTKDELLETAESQGANEDIMDTLRRIPMDSFNSPSDVAEGISQIHDGE